MQQLQIQSHYLWMGKTCFIDAIGFLHLWVISNEEFQEEFETLEMESTGGGKEGGGG